VLVMSKISYSASRSSSHAWRLVASVFAICACLAAPALVTAVAQAQQSQISQQSPGSSAQGQTGTGVGQTSSVSATVEECLTAVDPTGRSATFTGQMLAVSGTARMTMRIDVQERAAGETLFHTLNAPGLGVWRRSASGVKIYKYLKQVTNLPSPASFRAVVRFRWLNEAGRTIKHAERRTPACEQFDPRAKLVIGTVRVTPLAGSSQAEYQVTLRNEGHTAAAAFGVLLNVGGLSQTLSVPSLSVGARTVLSAQAPHCAPGSTLEVQLDPAHQIQEAIGGGLTKGMVCPGEAGGTVGDSSGTAAN
jgi:hypothetical protein